ncbi:MAG: LptF/LptG family permease [Bacteroidota bacterium]
MKKINILVIKAFIGPFIATFFISMFLFLMLFLWKWIDDLVGKGLEWHVITRLLFFSMADLIPMALPLAVLISSLMTFGNLSESYEMVALKASGVSIYRALMPAFVIIIILAFITFYVSNIVIPKANLEAKSLLWDVRNKKPAFDLKEGVFYDGIDGYKIKIGKKEADNETIKDILIYEVKPGYSQLIIVRAESGRMKLSDDKRLLYFTLNNGTRYEELVENANYAKTYPSTITKFESQKMTFDLGDLELKNTDKDLFKGSAVMMNIVELEKSIDSIKREIKRKQNTTRDFLKPYYPNPKILMQNHVNDSPKLVKDTIIYNFAKENRYNILELALSTSRNLKDLVESSNEQLEELQTDARLFRIKWHEKFTLSTVLIILFLIAAPLGTIIRKGGLGMPLVVSILMFIVYYIINMIGIKMGREGVLPEWLGAWIASLVLLPIGLFILQKASKESALFQKDKFDKLIERIKMRFAPKSE